MHILIFVVITHISTMILLLIYYIPTTKYSFYFVHSKYYARTSSHSLQTVDDTSTSSIPADASENTRKMQIISFLGFLIDNKSVKCLIFQTYDE